MGRTLNNNLIIKGLKMLRHTTISKTNFNDFQVALVETSTDYVVAVGYHGHNKNWSDGYYFPKSSDYCQNMRSRRRATDCYIDVIYIQSAATEVGE